MQHTVTEKNSEDSEYNEEVYAATRNFIDTAMEHLPEDSKEYQELNRILNKLLNDGLISDSLYERIMEKIREEYEKSKQTKMKAAIDPSGYVYEAVDSNRAEGVRATIYFRETMDSDAEILLWDAEEYGQYNPLYTDELGWYAWDVPEGFWQVKYEKTGYETAYSDWLPVPPPQLDVNVGIVSERAPEVSAVNVYPDGAEMVFSQYMSIPTVISGLAISADGAAAEGTWTAVDAEPSPNDPAVSYATVFRFEADTVLSGDIRLTADGVQNYAGTPMERPYAATLSVKEEITGLHAEESMTVAYGESRTVTVTAVPGEAAAGRILLLRSSDTNVLNVAESVAFDESGTAVFRVNALLPGEADIRYQVEGMTHAGSIRISSEVGAETDGDEASPEPTYRKGDIETDGDVDMKDVLKLREQHITEGKEIPYKGSLDFNGDTEVDAEDVRYLLGHVLLPKLYRLKN